MLAAAQPVLILERYLWSRTGWLAYKACLAVFLSSSPPVTASHEPHLRLQTVEHDSFQGANLVRTLRPQAALSAFMLLRISQELAGPPGSTGFGGHAAGVAILAASKRRHLRMEDSEQPACELSVVVFICIAFFELDRPGCPGILRGLFSKKALLNPEPLAFLMMQSLGARAKGSDLQSERS